MGDQKVTPGRGLISGTGTDMKARHTGHSGFTLVELMIVIAIMAIMMAVAAPGWIDTVRNGAVKSTGDRLLSSMSFARSEAIKRNTIVSVCPSSNSTTCSGSWGNGSGWIVISDSEVIRTYNQLEDDVLISGSSQIDFQGSGTGATTATLKVIHSEAQDSGDAYQDIVVTATGRAFVYNKSED